MDVVQSLNFCTTCGSERKYSNQYDAYYCELCNVWKEEKCGDSEMCNYRPEKPSQIISNEI